MLYANQLYEKHLKYSDVFLGLSFPMWSYLWFCFPKSEKIRPQCIYQNTCLPFSCFWQTSFSYSKTLGWGTFLTYCINLPFSSSASLHILSCYHPTLLLPPDLCLTQPHISFHNLLTILTLTICLFSVLLVLRVSPIVSLNPLQQFPHSKQFCTSYECFYINKFSILSKRNKNPFLIAVNMRSQL